MVLAWVVQTVTTSTHHGILRTQEKGGAVNLAVTSVLLGLIGGGGPPEAVVPRLEVSPAARAALVAFAASPTERLGCLLGSADGATVHVDSVVVMDDSAATSTRAVARTPCPPQALGRVHSHPGAERCWYWFPGTQVETSDAASFRRGGYPVDAIVCGPTLVYVTRKGGAEQQTVALVDRTVRVVLSAMAIPLPTTAGHIDQRRDHRLDWGAIDRWRRAIRSAWRPRIAQSLHLTVGYRRPVGGRLGILVEF